MRAMQKLARLAVSKLLDLLWWVVMLAALSVSLLSMAGALCAVYYVSLRIGDLIFDRVLYTQGTAVVIFFGLFCFFRQYDMEPLVGGIMNWCRDRMDPLQHLADDFRR